MNNGDEPAGRRTSTWRIASLVFVFAGGLIVFATVALLHVGNVASHQADDLALENQRRLLADSLHQRLMQIARDQLTVARWDEAVEKVVRKFDRAFVRREVVEALWYDFAHDGVWLFGPDGRLLVAARGEKIDFAPPPLPPNDPLVAVARRASSRFVAARIAAPGGFTQKAVASSHVDRVAEFGYLPISEHAALVSAMAIVPDDGNAVLPDGPPTVLVSAQFVTPELIGEIDAPLGLADLAFTPGADGVAEQAHHDLETPDQRRIGTFTWTRDRPGARIWSEVLPVSVFLTSLLALAALIVTRRIATLSGRLEASETDNRRLAQHDSMSGLANRLHFDRQLKRAVARLPETPFAVLACDLDRFKAVNDTFGHAAGDAVIRAVGARLGRLVGEAGLVGRTGGDEFVARIDAFTDVPRLTILAQEIIAEICAPVPLHDGTHVSVGISIGIAVAPDCGTSDTSILAAADAALYAAKERGRGVAVFAHARADRSTPNTLREDAHVRLIADDRGLA